MVPLTIESLAVIEVASTLVCAWAVTDEEIAVGVPMCGSTGSAAGVTRVDVVVGSRAPVVGIEGDLDAGSARAVGRAREGVRRGGAG